MKDMLDHKDCLSLDAAKLYYNSGFSQAEVAAHLGISRPTVSKLLTHAAERGFVTVSITDPREQSDELVSALCERFSLADARVTATPPGGSLLADLGSAGAALLEELITDHTSVGLSWGETMSAVASHLRKRPLEGVDIVQLKGGHSHSERSTKDLQTMQAFTQAFNAEAHLLPSRSSLIPSRPRSGSSATGTFPQSSIWGRPWTWRYLPRGPSKRSPWR